MGCFGVFDLKHSIRDRRPSTMIEELCHRFSLAQLQKATNNFDQSRRIVSHHFITLTGMYKGFINICGTSYTVQIKRFHKKYDQLESNRQLTEFRNEIQLLCQLHHPNLVSLIGFCDEKNELFLVYEYMPNRSLSDHLHHHWGGYEPLSWKKRLEILIGAARGLHYLHTGAKHTVYHRDIRTCNILLDENWVPKLAGFGISLRGPSFMSKVKSIHVDVIRGKVGYQPPEYSLEGIMTDKCDVYLFGMVMLEVACGKKFSMTLTQNIEETKDDHNKNEDNDRKDEDGDENEYVQWYILNNLATRIRNYVEKGNAREVIDPHMLGKIAPECWKMYIDIAQSCMLYEATERPTMGQVQLELEHALETQEEAGEANNERIDAEQMEIDSS